MISFEDLHWADDSSLFVLGYLARKIYDQKILVVGTARPGENPDLDRSMTELADDSNAELLKLGTIRSSEVKNLINEFFHPNNFADKLEAQLEDICEGNPFFITETLNHMAQEGTIQLQSDGFVLADEHFERQRFCDTIRPIGC